MAILWSMYLLNQEDSSVDNIIYRPGGARVESWQNMGAAQSRPIDGEVIPVRVIEVGDPRGRRDASRFVSERDSLSF